MAAQVAHVANVNRQIIARLPLNIERLVERVGKLVLPVVHRRMRKAVAMRDALQSAGRDSAMKLVSAGFPKAARRAHCPMGLRKSSTAGRMSERNVVEASEIRCTVAHSRTVATG